MPKDPTEGDWCHVRGTDLLLRLRIQPRASHEGLEGVREGRLRVRVSAAPVDGAANERLILILARAMQLPRSTLRLVRGLRGRDKEVLVSGGAARCTELRERLASHQQT
jgi:uncharacterized protein (TIGR00251 family)